MVQPDHPCPCEEQHFVHWMIARILVDHFDRSLVLQTSKRIFKCLHNTKQPLSSRCVLVMTQALSKKGALNPSSLNGRASTLPQAAPHGLAAGGRWFSTPQALKKATTAAASACKTPGRQPSKQVQSTTDCLLYPLTAS